MTFRGEEKEMERETEEQRQGPLVIHSVGQFFGHA